MMDVGLLRGLGLDDDTATALAELIAEETEKQALQLAEQLLLERMEKLPRLLSHTPGATVVVDRESFARMGYDERARLHGNNPQLYCALAKQ